MNANRSVQDDLILGIDGGGTKTVAWLGRLTPSAARLTTPPESPVVIGKGVGGPGNGRSIGFPKALQNVGAAIANAFTDAGIASTTVAKICYCLAGAGRAAEQQLVRQWTLEHGIAQSARVVHDAEALLATVKLSSGIALIAGTGSLAWGRTDEGTTARCGGWGYLIDDLGSAYSIGHDCLKAVVQAADGRAPKTELTEAVLKHFELSEPSELIATIYDTNDSRGRIAGIAPVVFAMEEVDPMARAILTANSGSLSNLVATVAKQIGFTNNAYPLVVGGSVLVRQCKYRTRLREHLETEHCAPSELLVAEQPVMGALTLAAQMTDST